MFFDSHAHLTSDELYPKLGEILPRAKRLQVEGIVNICTDRPTLERGLELAKTTPWIYNAGSTTPHDVEALGEKEFGLFEKAAKEGSLHAVGETGLDYHYYKGSQETQKTFLKRYLELALSTDLPVIFHCREAFDDLFEMADSMYQSKRAILHCFTGNMKEAEGVLKRGWLLSISGIVTFKRSTELREIVKEVPLDQLLIETDAPYLAPQSHRGKLNEPSYISETAQCIADEKGIPIEQVAKATAQNIKTFLRLSN